uniref:Transposon TX1 uncharacterized n=1 Tax=Cajanus cajan TaxID=3821 RepID=A0A151RGD7_CAJCA|nr:Transposon TX1 uncharacterized [Cajanus cajan]
MYTWVPPDLGVEAQSALTTPVTKEEVRQAVMSMKSFKAPGPYGFQPFFFKQYWPIVGDELWRTVKDAFRLGFSDISLLETQMVLISKVEHPVSLKEFRPISLCNVAWKVISKVIVARLRPFLQDIIGPFQGSFIPGRGTHNHSIIAQEAFHFVRKEGSGVGSLTLKIDLEKAYDRVRRPIARLVASTLEEFSHSSGLRVNLTKFVSSRRVSQRRILGIAHTARIVNYLGVPMTHGQPRCANFYDVIEKIHGRLAAWKPKLLNKASKLCLVKSAISSIPVYSMQSLWLLQAMCNRINQACRRMLWTKSDNTRFWSPVNWDVVTQPKELGGLRVREARRVNVSLIGKLVWDLLSAPQKPWVQLLSSLYLRGDSILCAQKRRGASPTWSSIIKALPSLREGFKPQLDSGASSLWYTDWSGTGLWCRKVPSPSPDGFQPIFSKQYWHLISEMMFGCLLRKPSRREPLIHPSLTPC